MMIIIMTIDGGGDGDEIMVTVMMIVTRASA